MTTERYTRCVQCGDMYIYRASGAIQKFNHQEWCPGCKEVVDKALSTVPRKFECRYRPIQEITTIKGLSDITLEFLLVCEATVQPGCFRRIFVPLYNLETGDAQHSREIKANGLRFKVTTWRQDPEYSIELPMEYDIENQGFTGQGWPF